jgi:peroxiredoxin
MGGMPAVSSFMVPLGSPAPDFKLPSVDGRVVALADFADEPVLLVVFLSNHCPYVRHIERGLARVAADYAGAGLATIGICSNDVVRYPDDGARELQGQARRAGFEFPYLVDETQDVAKAYRAACTPDFFLYGPQRSLAYRGEMDGARPSNDVRNDGRALRAAIDLVLSSRPVPEPHRASMGCSIKWKPGNEPA